MIENEVAVSWLIEAGPSLASFVNRLTGESGV